jgi:hypothetical protein
MHEITALYEKATEPHRRPFRKPVREAQARALRSLSIKADQLVTETEPWDSDARLASVDARERDEVRTNVVAFRDSLHGLRDAADRSSTADLRKYHAAALASYRQLTEITNPVD